MFLFHPRRTRACSAAEPPPGSERAVDNMASSSTPPPRCTHAGHVSHPAPAPVPLVDLSALPTRNQADSVEGPHRRACPAARGPFVGRFGKKGACSPDKGGGGGGGRPAAHRRRPSHPQPSLAHRPEPPQGQGGGGGRKGGARGGDCGLIGRAELTSTTNPLCSPLPTPADPSPSAWPCRSSGRRPRPAGRISAVSCQSRAHSHRPPRTGRCHTSPTQPRRSAIRPSPGRARPSCRRHRRRLRASVNSSSSSLPPSSTTFRPRRRQRRRLHGRRQSRLSDSCSGTRAVATSSSSCCRRLSSRSRRAS